MNIDTKHALKKFFLAEQYREAAEERLKDLAKHQIELTIAVYADLDLSQNTWPYEMRGFKYYNWMEFNSAGYYYGDSQFPELKVELWERGRGGDGDRQCGSFVLSQHILNGEPEKFITELTKKLEVKADEAKLAEARYKAAQIDELEKKIRILKGEA